MTKKTGEVAISVNKITYGIGLFALILLLYILIFIPKGAPSAMERFTTFLFFIVVCWGLGFTATMFIKWTDNILERTLMSVGLGLGIFPILSIFLNTLRVPLQPVTFLILSLIVPVVSFVRGNREFGKFEKDAPYVLMAVLLSLFVLFVYAKGAFAYPYLEDDDPWEHAVGSKYVSIKKTYSIPADQYVAHYLEPYPPTYDVLMGVLHQLNSSILWTLKFFNALLISMSVFFCFYFVKKFSGDVNVALLAAFFLAVIPSFSSHFIWSQTLGVVLFFPAFYAMESIKDDKRWLIITALVVSSIMVVQTSAALTFGLFFMVYYFGKVITEKKLMKHVFLAGLLGFMISMFYWAPTFSKFGYAGVADKLQLGGATLGQIKLKPGGSDVDRLYTLAEFMGAPIQTHIAQPKGLGFVLFWLLIISLILIIKDRKLMRDQWVKISILWLILTIAGIESAALPITIMPSRFWTFLTIPVVIIAAKGTTLLLKISKNQKIPGFYVLGIIVIGVLMTSATPKYRVETAQWGPGSAWVSGEQIVGFLALRELPPDTRVFPLCMKDDYVIGLDKLSFPWDQEVLDFREVALNKTAKETNDWLKAKSYDYLVVDVSCLKKCNADQETCANWLNEKLNELNNPRLFELKQRNGAVFVFKVI